MRCLQVEKVKCTIDGAHKREKRMTTKTFWLKAIKLYDSGDSYRSDVFSNWLNQISSHCWMVWHSFKNLVINMPRNRLIFFVFLFLLRFIWWHFLSRKPNRLLYLCYVCVLFAQRKQITRKITNKRRTFIFCSVLLFLEDGRIIIW